MTEKRSGEFSWIAKHFAPLAGAGSFGLRDDAALLRADGPLVVTQDTIVEGVHFFADDAPRDVALKAIGVNASDIVAKGSTPIGFTLGLGVPDRWRDADVADFADGLLEYADSTHAITNGYPVIVLLGGDTTRSPGGLFVSVTMFGRPGERYVSREGARPGDTIVVCGTIGDGYLGLLMRRGDVAPADGPLERYLRPAPAFQVAPVVASKASAAMDVSDGLVGDLAKLAAASGVRCEIDLGEVPLSVDGRAYVDGDRDRFPALATGGDDYVVLMTVPAANMKAVRTALGTRASTIGHVFEGEGIGVSLDGVPLNLGATSYTHD